MMNILDKKDKCIGGMLGSAIGDALGWPFERVNKNLNKLSSSDNLFVEWLRKAAKPYWHNETILAGEYSDDTQLTLAIARSLLSNNWQRHFREKELPFWLKYERGGGSSLLKSAKMYSKHMTPWQTKICAQDYFQSGGNGGVMRILPHVILNHSLKNLDSLIDGVITDVFITHGHPRAILGATCYAFSLNYLLNKASVLEYGELPKVIIEHVECWSKYLILKQEEIINKYCIYDYYKEWQKTKESMIKGLSYIEKSLKKALLIEDNEILENLGCFGKENGAGDVTILASIYYSSKYANNPLLGLKSPALSVGIDTDTIASITGGLLGMLHGTNWIPLELKKIQDYHYIVNLSSLLFDDNRNKNINQYMESELFQLQSPLGLLRLVDTNTVTSGKHLISINKWKSLGGQTIYIKTINKNIEKKNKSIVFDSNTINDLINQASLKNINARDFMILINDILYDKDISVLKQKYVINDTLLKIIMKYIKQ